MDNIISLHDVKKSYRGASSQETDVLHIKHLHIAYGEHVSLTGPSGCGKSTLLHLLGGVMEPTSGEVIVHNEHLERLSMKEKDAFRANHIGFIFQDFHLIPSLTASENIKVALPKRSQQRERIPKWFERIGLEDKQTNYPHELSRGQQQRVAFIRALIHGPKLVLADEPTGSLDVQTAKGMMTLLLDICKEDNITLLCVTHDLTLASAFPRTIAMETLNQEMKRGVPSP